MIPPSVKIVGIVEPSQIQLDPNNANLGTEAGHALLSRSIEKYGAARGVVLDSKNVDVAGNKTLEEAVSQGIPVFVVETEGDVLVATRRRDWDLAETPEAKEYAIVDNRAGELNLAWNTPVLIKLSEDPRINTTDMGFTRIQLEDMKVRLAREGDRDDDPTGGGDPGNDPYRQQWGVIIVCDGEDHQKEVYDAVSNMGYNAKVVVT